MEILLSGVSQAYCPLLLWLSSVGDCPSFCHCASGCSGAVRWNNLPCLSSQLRLHWEARLLQYPEQSRRRHLGAALPSLLLLGAEQSGFFTLFLSSSAESCSSVNCFHALCKELHRMGVFWITARVLSVCWTRSPDPKGSSWVFSIASR